MADVVKALVHRVGTATVGVRVPAAATKKGHWEDPLHRMCPNSSKKIQTTLEDLDVY